MSAAQKVMIVTGGSRGIGAATALLAARSGYAVCINYAGNQAAADSVVATIASAGGKAIAVQGDVSRESDVMELFAANDAAFGRLDCLVNNAGLIGMQSRLEDIDHARFERILAVNVLGPHMCSREAVKRMSTARGGDGGAIVNVSSMAARLGSPNEYVDYAASKGALDTMTIGLAKEVATEGIRVNAVRPGLIYTDIHAAAGEPGRVDRLAAGVPLGRGGTAQEVAEAILWLASEKSSYTTGSFIDVSGGR
ncbi:MAG: NAD(P)-dependent oxidoreductase [Hyphomicrobiales bacterium]|nr:MAG: NAD(P)-dependent oxidoreductase [Hyphomicrobiales bacterium]